MNRFLVSGSRYLWRVEYGLLRRRPLAEESGFRVSVAMMTMGGGRGGSGGG